MHTSPVEPPDGLQQNYQDLAQLYELALSIAASLRLALEAGAQPEAELNRLAQTMAEVGEVEQRLTVARQQWEAAGHGKTAGLQAAVVRVRELLVQLIDSISLAEQSALAARNRLSPRLSAETVSQRMRAAYAASANT